MEQIPRGASFLNSRLGTFVSELDQFALVSGYEAEPHEETRCPWYVSKIDGCPRFDARRGKCRRLALIRGVHTSHQLQRVPKVRPYHPRASVQNRHQNYSFDSHEFMCKKHRNYSRHVSHEVEAASSRCFTICMR